MSDPQLFLVFTNPVEGREDEYNQWYDEVHVPDVMAVPGVKGAQRYQLAPSDSQGGGAPPAHRYLAVYEIDGDPAGVFAEFTRRIGTGEMVLSEAMDLAGVSMAVWEPRPSP